MREQLGELRAKMYSIGENATSDLAKKDLEISRLQSKCTVYRSQQVRDAQVRAEFEKRLARLRVEIRLRSGLRSTDSNSNFDASEVSQLESFLDVIRLWSVFNRRECMAVPEEQAKIEEVRLPSRNAGKSGAHESFGEGGTSPLRNLYDILLEA